MIALSLEMAEYQLSGLIEIRNTDDQWDDKDVHVDNATEVALRQIISMKKMQIANYKDFAAEWFYAAAPVNLAAKTFSRTNCLYERFLGSVVVMFDEMCSAVEFVSLGED